MYLAKGLPVIKFKVWSLYKMPMNLSTLGWFKLFSNATWKKIQTIILGANRLAPLWYTPSLKRPLSKRALSKKPPLQKALSLQSFFSQKPPLQCLLCDKPPSSTLPLSPKMGFLWFWRGQLLLKIWWHWASSFLVVLYILCLLKALVQPSFIKENVTYLLQEAHFSCFIII